MGKIHTLISNLPEGGDFAWSGNAFAKAARPSPRKTKILKLAIIVVVVVLTQNNAISNTRIRPLYILFLNC